MRSTFLGLLIIYAFSASAQSRDSVLIRKMFSETLTAGKCYSTLEHLSKKIGARLSGSDQAGQAVEYLYGVMRQYGFDSVWLQPVMVPHWVRGEKEQAWMMVNGKKEMLSVCALGNSIGTGKKGISANIVEVRSFEELAKLGKENISGKIVFYNRPFPDDVIIGANAYGVTVNQRGQGAVQAARYGAVGVIVRSMTHALDDHPHTGMMGYRDSITRIPGCAVSTIGANRLSAQLKKDPGTKVFFRQTCEMLPDVQSYNVIAEIRGWEFPGEIITVGGHLDSWDLGDGSHDDGAGCVQSLEVIRVLKALGIKPKRTIRAVMFMNEENGVRGGAEYANRAELLKENHIAALESDIGGFTPRAFHISEGKEKLMHAAAWEKLLRPYGIEEIIPGHSGTDIDPLKKLGTTCFGYMPDTQRYFDIHHAASDTFDKVNKRELELGAGCMTALIWLISEYGLN